MQKYSVEAFVSDIRAIVAAERDDGIISEKIKPLAERLTANES